MEEIEVVVAHNERATRVGDVFLTIGREAHQPDGYECLFAAIARANELYQSRMSS